MSISKFLDKKKIIVVAGNGGYGAVSFSKDRKRTPNGGHGGKGGDIIFKVSNEISNFNHLDGLLHFFATHGDNGGYNKCNGKNGKNMIIRIPIGTEVYYENKLIFYGKIHDEEYIVVHGGHGGKGNSAFLNSVRQCVDFSSMPQRGEKKILFLQLNYPANFIFLGAPASGKSTLLKNISNARVPLGHFGYKHSTPIIAEKNSIKFIEIPSIKPYTVSFNLQHTKNGILFFFLGKEWWKYDIEKIIQNFCERKIYFIVSYVDIMNKCEINYIKKSIGKQNIIFISSINEKSIKYMWEKILKIHNKK